MELRTALALVLLVGTSVGVGTAAATGPGIIVGMYFSEQFVDGFDHPEAVRSFSNLEFSPGRAELLAGGELA